MPNSWLSVSSESLIRVLLVELMNSLLHSGTIHCFMSVERDEMVYVCVTLCVGICV